MISTGHMVYHIDIVSSGSHGINWSHDQWITWYQLVTWYIPPSSMIFKLCLIAINGVQEEALGELLWLYRAELDVTRYSKLYLSSDISFVFSFWSQALLPDELDYPVTVYVLLYIWLYD